MKLRINAKNRFTTFRLIVGVLCCYLLITLWPVKNLLWPTNWWGKTLIVFMNDSEARPCGGFVTAFGVLDVPALDLKLKNAYHFEKVDYGPSPEPLNLVSARTKFWDLGTEYDLAQCSDQFGSAYWQAEGVRVDRTVLVQSQFLEAWVSLFGYFNLEGERVTHLNFFEIVSRKVADIDRHNEEVLNNRKQPLVTLGRQLIVKTAFNPFRWPQFTHLFRDGLDTHLIYWPGVSDFEALSSPLADANLVAVTEWNLGGGKSSRYLRKHWSVDFRETMPKKWSAIIRLDVDHLGQTVEPLSQVWTGGFEIDFYGEKTFIPATIEPGSHFTHELILPLQSGGLRTYNADGSVRKVGLFSTKLFTPYYQEWDTDFSVSPYPEQLQKMLVSYSGVLPAGGKEINWQSGLVADEQSPFLVIHKPLPPEVLPLEVRSKLGYSGTDILVELRFNEKIRIENLQASLSDLNRENDEVNDLVYKNHQLLEDGQTLVVNFAQTQVQVDERFNLTLSGVTDLWGNEAFVDKRTVITR